LLHCYSCHDTSSDTSRPRGCFSSPGTAGSRAKEAVGLYFEICRGCCCRAALLGSHRGQRPRLSPVCTWESQSECADEHSELRRTTFTLKMYSTYWFFLCCTSAILSTLCRPGSSREAGRREPSVEAKKSRADETNGSRGSPKSAARGTAPPPSTSTSTSGC